MAVTHCSAHALNMPISTGIVLSGGNKTLTEQETADTSVFEVTTGHASNCIILARAIPGRLIAVVNGDGVNAALIKVAGQSAITVAAGKKAILYCNGTTLVRLTADA